MVKIMQTSAIKVYFQIAECSLLMQKYKLNLRNSLPLEEYFRVVEQFDSTLSSVIDSTLGLRCSVDRSISWHVFSPWQSLSKIC